VHSFFLDPPQIQESCHLISFSFLQREFLCAHVPFIPEVLSEEFSPCWNHVPAKTGSIYLPLPRVTVFSGVTPARFCWCLCLLEWIFGESTPAKHKTPGKPKYTCKKKT
jgi:hypothetical protein